MSASRELLAVEYEPSAAWTPASAKPHLPQTPAARLARSGPSALADAEALSVLAGCRIDDATGLIQAFGSLTEVLAQPHADLVRHTSAGAAGRITLLHDVACRALRGPLQRRPVLSSWSGVIAYLKIALAGVPREQFRVLFLDKKNQLIVVHLTVRALGDHGERLNPKKADLEAWRQAFAEQLRMRGIAAEATPRRARGVTRKPERTPVRKLRDRHDAGLGPMPEVWRKAYQEAGRAAFGGDAAPRPWEAELQTTQVRLRRAYLQQAQVLRGSAVPADRELGEQVIRFVQAMPAPDSQRLALARELRAANRSAERDPPGEGRDRSR